MANMFLKLWRRVLHHGRFSFCNQSVTTSVSTRNLPLQQKSGLFSHKLRMKWSIVQLWLFHLWHLTKQFQWSDWAPESWNIFFYIMGTVFAVSYNNTLKDGLVLWQNTNNFKFHSSSSSIISLCPDHSSSVGSLMAWQRFCSSPKQTTYLPSPPASTIIQLSAKLCSSFTSPLSYVIIETLSLRCGSHPYTLFVWSTKTRLPIKHKGNEANLMSGFKFHISLAPEWDVRCL